MAELKDEEKTLTATQNGRTKKMIAEFAPKAEKYDLVEKVLKENDTDAEIVRKIRNILTPTKN